MAAAGRGTGPEQPTALVVPSADGVRALRLGGKQRLVAAWEPLLCSAGQSRATGLDLWLVDALPPAGREAEALAEASRTAPMIGDLVRDAKLPSLTCRVRVPYELRSSNSRYSPDGEMRMCAWARDTVWFTGSSVSANTTWLRRTTRRSLSSTSACRPT